MAAQHIGQLPHDDMFRHEVGGNVSDPQFRTPAARRRSSGRPLFRIKRGRQFGDDTNSGIALVGVAEQGLQRQLANRCARAGGKFGLDLVQNVIIGIFPRKGEQQPLQPAIFWLQWCQLPHQRQQPFIGDLGPQPE